MNRFLNQLFAPVLRPLLAMLLWAYSLMARDRASMLLTQGVCAVKCVLYAAMAVLLLAAIFTMRPSESSEMPLLTAQCLVLVAAYLLGALSVAHYRLAGHFRDCSKGG